MIVLISIHNGKIAESIFLVIHEKSLTIFGANHALLKKCSQLMPDCTRKCMHQIHFRLRPR